MSVPLRRKTDVKLIHHHHQHYHHKSSSPTCFADDSLLYRKVKNHRDLGSARWRSGLWEPGKTPGRWASSKCSDARILPSKPKGYWHSPVSAWTNAGNNQHQQLLGSNHYRRLLLEQELRDCCGQRNRTVGFRWGNFKEYTPEVKLKLTPQWFAPLWNGGSGDAGSCFFLACEDFWGKCRRWKM